MHGVKKNLFKTNSKVGHIKRRYYSAKTRQKKVKMLHIVATSCSFNEISTSDILSYMLLFRLKTTVCVFFFKCDYLETLLMEAFIIVVSKT